MKLLDMVWAREAGVKVMVYESDHDQRVLELWAVVDQRSRVVATATVESHNRDRLATLLSRADPQAPQSQPPENQAGARERLLAEIRERWANVPMMGVGIWDDGDSLYEEQEPHRTVGYLHKQIDRDVAIALSKSKSDIDCLLSLLRQPAASERCGVCLSCAQPIHLGATDKTWLHVATGFSHCGPRGEERTYAVPIKCVYPATGATSDLISRDAAMRAMCHMCAKPERYGPPKPLEGSERLFHFQGADNWNAGQCFAQPILNIPLAATGAAEQSWCDHCSADLNGVKHILCERCYREYAGPKWFDAATSPAPVAAQYCSECSLAGDAEWPIYHAPPICAPTPEPAVGAALDERIWCINCGNQIYSFRGMWFHVSTTSKDCGVRAKAIPDRGTVTTSETPADTDLLTSEDVFSETSNFWADSEPPVVEASRDEPSASPSSVAWRQWFERVGEHATVDVVNATAGLVMAERELYRVTANIASAREIVIRFMNTVSEGAGNYSCNKCELDAYLCPHLSKRLAEIIAAAWPDGEEVERLREKLAQAREDAADAIKIANQRAEDINRETQRAFQYKQERDAARADAIGEAVDRVRAMGQQWYGEAKARGSAFSDKGRIAEQIVTALQSLIDKKEREDG